LTIDDLLIDHSQMDSSFDILVKKPLRFLDQSNPKFEARNSKQIRRTEIQMLKTTRAFHEWQWPAMALFWVLDLKVLELFRISDLVLRI